MKKKKFFVAIVLIAIVLAVVLSLLWENVREVERPIPTDGQWHPLSLRLP